MVTIGGNRGQYWASVESGKVNVTGWVKNHISERSLN
jgi:hypothetical protein